MNYKKPFYVKSAELGNPAAYNLGVLYFQGRGVARITVLLPGIPKHPRKVLLPAQNNLGFLCQKGMGTEQSNTNAYGGIP